MTTVGIIANPASGKDIRRLVAHGSVFDNNEKVNILRRVLLGLHAIGVEQVVFMPDYFAIGLKALDGVKQAPSSSLLDMRVRGTQQDSTDAARLMAEMGVGCIITLGGDGTNRAVAKTCGDTPLVPISTGTNNVFPFMVESTVAGLAAGIVAKGIVDAEDVTLPTKRLEVLRDGEVVDIALVDVVVYDDFFIASRAIWDVSKVKEIVLSRSEPSNIGFSSVGGGLYCAESNSNHGVYLQLGQGTVEVTAPIAPGLIDRVGITGFRLLSIGDEVELTYKPSILALDGEREVEVRGDTRVSVQLSDKGPRVVDIGKALHEASKVNFFTSPGAGNEPAETCLIFESRVCLTPCISCLMQTSQTTEGGGQGGS
ncbi:MAG: ATP-NAD kinase family protein [Anaerolineae bacterium]